MVKVLLFASYGMTACTKKMWDYLLKDAFPRNRVGEIVKYVEKVAVDVESVVPDATSSKIVGYLAEHQDAILRVRVDKDSTKYLVYNKDINYTATIAITEVDTSKKWTIDSYDGAEYIKYLDLTCIDEELNYYEVD